MSTLVAHEAERLARLRGYALIGAQPDPRLDALASLAAFACRLPIAMVNLVDEDRVWVRAHRGLELCDAPRSAMFCSTVVDDEAPLIVPDLTRDPRFASYEFVTGEPGLRFYAGVPLRTVDGFVVGTVCVFDRTPRVLEPEALRALETVADQVMAWLELKRTTHTLETVFDQASDGIVIADERRRLSLNPTARELFAFDGAPVSVESLPSGAADDGRLLSASETPLARALAGEHVRDVRWSVPQRAAGASRVLDASAVPLRRTDGSRGGAVLIVRDQTARARLEQSVVESRNQAFEALRVRDDFLSIAAHELRTPLTALQLQAQSLRRHGLDSLPEPISRRLELLLRQGERLAGLINQLLDVSQITSNKLQLTPEPVDLRGLLEDVVARYAPQARRADCALEVDAPEPVIGDWDRGRLEQVLTNLLSNAMKYGAGRPIRIALRADDRKAVLSVRDEGMGISPQDQARIFERFERVAPTRAIGGLGLGLFIVRQIVLASHGSIEVHSALGRGATFVLTLPRTPAP